MNWTTDKLLQDFKKWNLTSLSVDIRSQDMLIFVYVGLNLAEFTTCECYI